MKSYLVAFIPHADGEVGELVFVGLRDGELEPRAPSTSFDVSNAPTVAEAFRQYGPWSPEQTARHLVVVAPLRRSEGPAYYFGVGVVSGVASMYGLCGEVAAAKHAEIVKAARGVL